MLPDAYEGQLLPGQVHPAAFSQTKTLNFNFDQCEQVPTPQRPPVVMHATGLSLSATVIRLQQPLQ